MAEKVALEIDIDAKGAATTLGQLEQESERLNEELRKVPLGTKAFKDLKQQLVNTNKEIKNTELSMEALDNEQVASELGSVAGAVGDGTLIEHPSHSVYAVAAPYPLLAPSLALGVS